MTITAAEVMKLREKTGLGMMVCKKALIESDGDMDKAIENLRKQGQATAEKRAGKAAKEGKVNIIIADTEALIYEVNSETDFVAKNEDFLSFADNVGTILINQKPDSVDTALKLTSEIFNGQSVEAKILEIVGKIGEKIFLRRFNILNYDKSNESVFSYIHGNGKIGVLVILKVDSKQALDSAELAALGKDLAMQIAASRPCAIDRERIPENVVVKEKEIYLSQVQSSGKPEKIWDKIVEGKMNKFYKEAVLLEQAFIRDTEMSVTDRIQQTEKSINTNITISSFARYELGEEE